MTPNPTGTHQISIPITSGGAGSTSGGGVAGGENNSSTGGGGDLTEMKSEADHQSVHNNSGRWKFESIRIAAVVVFYWITSLSVVFLNKFVMNYADFKFPYPLMFTWFQLIVAAICWLGMSILGRTAWCTCMSFIPPFELRLRKCRAVLPLSLVYIGMIAANNLCLKFVEISFYQVARSWTVIFTSVLSYLLLQTRISTRTILACIVIVLGYILGAVGEVHFSWPGVIYGGMSSMFVSLYSMSVKQKIGEFGNNEWLLLWYNTAVSIVIFIPILLLTGEFTATMMTGGSLGPISTLSLNQFWIATLFTGIFGYLINISTFLQIKYTSALTHNISGTAKACAQTVLGFIVVGNPVTLLNAFGTFVCILGSGWYAKVKHEEMSTVKKL